MAVALHFLLGHSRSQEILWEHAAVPNLTTVNNLTAAIGDVDGDGYRDIVVEMEVWGSVDQVWTLSGKDGRPLRSRAVLPAGTHIAALASAGDADGDGIDDYVVTNWDQSSRRGPMIVEVRSGRDERVIWQATKPWESYFGFSVEGGLDVDGDGKPDVVMTAPGEGPYGAVYAYSNQGTQLYRVASTPQSGRVLP